MTHRVRPFLLLTLAALAVAAGLRAAEPARWWSPGEGGRLPAYATYPNEYGEVGVLNSSGPIETKGHSAASIKGLSAEVREAIAKYLPAEMRD